MSSSVGKKKVFIGITAYDSRMDVLCALSVINNVKTLEAAGWDVDLQVQMGDCYIDQARNHLVHRFLQSDRTDMIFVDNDLSFDPDAMLKLLKLPCQVVGGTYPYRGDQEGFPISIKQDENGVPIGNVEVGIIETTHVPTGLMRIHRSVFAKLKTEYPDIVDDQGEYKFFRTGLLFKDKGDRRYYGEDVSFCKICDDVGIKVWCEPRITFGHIGRTGRIGNFDKYLRENALKKKAA